MGAQTVICPSNEALAAWASSALAQDERDELEGHAAACPACREAVIALRGLSVRGARPTLGADGAMIGRYRVLGPAGQGAMGVVLRGHDPVLDRQVALKLINAIANTEAQRARMLREAQTLARLDHPNVVDVYDAGIVDNEVFVAMEFVTGDTLTRWLAAPRSLAERVEVLAGVGQGIAAVHAAGLVHRDIKPDNILVRDGAAVLVDFGLALTAEAAPSAAGSGIAGTPGFLAPEVRAGARASALSDQYAWWTVVDDTLRDVPLPPRQRRALANLIARGRATDPGERFPSMADGVAALTALFAVRRRVWPWLAAGALAVGAAGLAFAVGAPREDDPCAPKLPAEWTSARRTQLIGSLSAAGTDWSRILTELDARASQTRELRAKTCLAASGSDHARRTHALRQRLCVDETWRHTAALLEGLADPARNTVWAAVDELVTILPLSRCASDAAIPGVAAPPRADQMARVREVEAELRRVRLDRELDPETRLAELRELEPKVRALDYGPFLAAWHSDVADAFHAMGQLSRARAELEAAARVSEAAGDDDERARALINALRLAWVSGDQDTADIEAAAEALVARVGNPSITAELRKSQTQIRSARGDQAGALAAAREAVQHYEAVALDAHDQLVGALQNLGVMEQATGDPRAAAATLERSYALARRRHGDNAIATLVVRGARATNLMVSGDLAAAHRELEVVERGFVRAFGETHPQVANVRSYLCEAASSLRAEDAATWCESALRTAEAVFGPDHPQIVWQLGLLGQWRVIAGEPVAALAPLERALALAEHGTISPLERATAQATLAIALHRARRDFARARRLARVAHESLRGAPTVESKVAELEAEFPDLAPER